MRAPKGYALDHYLEVLAEIRERTVSYFGEQAERRLVAKATFPIVPLAMLLRNNDPEADTQQYEKLATAVGTTFSDDGAVNKSGETDLIHLLQLHETYHRGQITFQKYIYARLRVGDQVFIFPIDASRASFEKVRNIYEVFEAPGAIDQEVFEGDHFFNGAKGIPFVVQQLRAQKVG